MAASVDRDLGRIVRRARPGRLTSLSRHDLLLAVIPSAFVVAVLVGSVLDLRVETALAGAAFVCLLAVLDAVVFNPPLEDDAAT